MTRAQGLAVARYLARHPEATATLARAGWRLRRRGWWRQSPFLPLAPKEYWTFRLVTASGEEGVMPGAEEMVRAAEWSVRQKVRR